MKSRITFSLVFLIAATTTSPAQTSTNAASRITGTWKGTSICQIKNSPCKDEIAVYHITSLTSADSVMMKMNKVVNGQEEEMGDLKMFYDRTAKTLRGVTKDRRQRENIWLFEIHNDKIEGKLKTEEGLYRIIKLTKEK